MCILVQRQLCLSSSLMGRIRSVENIFLWVEMTRSVTIWTGHSQTHENMFIEMVQ